MIIANNTIHVKPGEPHFDLMTNACKYFEIGTREGDDVWLEGRIVDGQPIFNGRLFLRKGGSGTVIDSFPKGHTPEAWQQRRRLDIDGYELLDADGESVFSYSVNGNICSVDLNLYAKDGQLAANAGQGGLVCHVQATIGLGGIAFRPIGG